MRKLLRRQFLIMLSALSFSGSSWLMIDKSKAEKYKSVIERLRDLFRRQPTAGSTQGEFCAIAPNPSNPNFLVTWSDRPLFVWQGTVTQIEVSHRAGEPDIVWSPHILTPEEQNQQSIIYGGSALEPGQEYTCVMTYETIDNEQRITKEKEIRFFVLGSDHEKRRRIEAKLAELVNQTSMMNTEEMALARAEIFAEEDLWLDVIRETFSVQNSSSEWKRTLQEYVNEECK
ncbi:MAG: hypothetical protein RH949_07225 [Coleofasciculus sp. A1-SPW-01]|uniref:hypothetical protein n=1 Tax=Coleofasciculus sp. A1-SPW-01 TaxID=3070819 RepID=UPI0032FBEB75